MAAEPTRQEPERNKTSHDFSPLGYHSEHRPTWCPGCGGFGVVNALYKAMADLKLRPEMFVLVSGIGCSSRLPEFVKAYGFHSVHGRALTIATGIKLARPELEVMAIGGDGDGLAIGGNHFMHAARRNIDIAYVMIDNSVYGMTKGQPSPTSEMGVVSKASPYGVLEQPVNPPALAISFGATFVARGFSGDTKGLETLIVKAIQHKGFAFVHVLSPCITFNDSLDFWRANTAEVEQHNLGDRFEAYRLALISEKVRLGLLYQKTEETFDQKYAELGLYSWKGEDAQGGELLHRVQVGPLRLGDLFRLITAAPYLLCHLVDCLGDCRVVGPYADVVPDVEALVVRDGMTDERLSLIDDVHVDRHGESDAVDLSILHQLLHMG